MGKTDFTRDDIEIIGASENNLKHINVTIPKGKLVVFAGVSGSGKSSLAFDTIRTLVRCCLQKGLQTFHPYPERQFESFNMMGIID